MAKLSKYLKQLYDCTYLHDSKYPMYVMPTEKHFPIYFELLCTKAYDAIMPIYIRDDLLLQMQEGIQFYFLRPAP